MAQEVSQALLVLSTRLIGLITSDPELRTGFRALARAVLAATEPSDSDREERAEPSRSSGPDSGGWGDSNGARPPMGVVDPAVVAPSPTQPFPRSRSEQGMTPAPLGELTLGQSRPRDPDPQYDAMATASGDDSVLLEIVTRCRMKAEGARWAAARQIKMYEGADFRAEIAPRDREVIEKAGAIPGCFLWTNTANFRPPEDLGLMDELADCFEVMAEAVTLVLGLLDAPRSRRAHLAQGLDLLAETQSALRVAILRVGGTNDSDQFRVYQWIRQVANAEGHFIHRYMKLEDPAEPTRAPWTRSQIAALMAGFEREGQRGRQRENRLNTLRWHITRLGKSDGDRSHWGKIAQSIHEMVTVEKIPPSAVELRETLLPIWDQLPMIDNPPPGYALVLRELERYLDDQDDAASATDAPTSPRDSPETREVADLLRGRAVLMIGGQRQPHAQAALASAFDLSELIWFDAKEHGSNDFFRPSIARPDVALVLLAIRWSSHSFGDVKLDCDRLGKPLVRLPAGYNPQQVATQILAQSSDQLRQLPSP